MDYLWVLEPESEYNISGNEYDAVKNKHDKGYKYLLSVKRVFLQLLRSFVDKTWVNRIDEDSVEFINKSFILQDFKGKEADIVYRVKIDGKEVFFYILLELQSTVDYQMPYRLLQYMLEIWRTILKDTNKAREKQNDNGNSIENQTNNEPEVTAANNIDIVKNGREFQLPAIIPCVLYNGKQDWTVPKSYRKILSANDLFDDYIVDFNYILIDVARYSEEELLSLGNLLGAVFYIDQKQQYDEIIERLKNLVDKLKNLTDEDFDLFRVWLKNIIARYMPKEEALEIEKIIESNKGVNSMEYNLGIAIRDKMKEMKQEGLQEGKQEGKLEVAKNLFKAGMDIDKISEVTGIPVHELQKLLL